MATYETLLVSTDNGITTITFNRPEKRNAMSPQLHREMFDLLTEIRYDKETRVVVLTGDRRPGEHDAEQEQHDDGADVDEHLGGGHELRGEEHVDRTDRGEHGHEVERGVDDVLGGDDSQGAEHDHGREGIEEEVLRDHQRGTFLTLASDPAS